MLDLNLGEVNLITLAEKDGEIYMVSIDKKDLSLCDAFYKHNINNLVKTNLKYDELIRQLTTNEKE